MVRTCRQKLGLAPHCSGNTCLGVDPRGVFHALAGIASGQPGFCVLQISENHCGFGSWLGLILMLIATVARWLHTEPMFGPWGLSERQSGVWLVPSQGLEGVAKA